jgi:hypothetical protein
MGVLINIILLLVFQRINPFLTLSMVVKHVDDCIKKIELDDDTNLYTRDNITCSYADGFNLDYDIPIFPPIPYELGQKIKILIGDKGQNCSLKMEIKVNDNIIKDNDIQFWTCENCNNFGFNYDNNMLNCYPPGTNDIQNDYNFFFEISSLAQLDFNTSEKYDLIFIDAAKSQYIKFFNKFTFNLNKKGYVVTDNINFHGLTNSDKSKMSRNLRQLITKLERYINFLKDNKNFKTRFFEVGDGIAISRRRKNKDE